MSVGVAPAHLDPLRRRPAWRRAWPWAAGLVAAVALDRPAWVLLSAKTAEAQAAINAEWWFRGLWWLGRMEVWAIAAGLLVVVDLARGVGGSVVGGLRRGTLLLLGTGVTGLLAEGLKVVFRRERPILSEGWYSFRPFMERTFDGSGLGLPSGHAAVAFGAALALMRMFPAWTPVFLAIGIAGATGRVLAGAHYLSDTYVSLVLAAVVVGFFAAWDRRNNAGRAIALHC